MKPIVVSLTVAALIAAAACNRAEETGSRNSASQDSAVSDAATGNVTAAPAGQMTAAQAYDLRHERYEEMGDSLKAINRELKGGAPDLGRVRREAAALATLADQIPTWFPAGSGPDVNLKSRAKAEIWSDPEGFRRAHGAYLEQAQRFRQVAEEADVAAIRQAAGELGRSCGTCHNGYRGPER